MRTLLRFSAAIGLAVWAFVQSLGADPIILTTFDYPGQSQTVLDGINGHDQIVGRYGDTLDLFPSAGFFITNPVGAISSSWSFPSTAEISGGAYGIDNSGQVAGSYFDRVTSTDVAYLRSADGIFTPLPWPSGATSAAMNSHGNLVYSGVQNLYFPKGDGTYTSVSVTGAGPSANVYVTGYDTLGDVTGYVYDPLSFSTFAFVRDTSGSYTILDFPGSVYTEALGMNDVGQVVGDYYDGTDDHAFIWSASAGFTTIDFPGAQLTLLDGISDDGTVVGGYILNNGSYFNGLIGTEAVATPEPKSVGIEVAGILLVAIIGGKRRQTGLMHLL